jgi:hypothetical protein
MEVIIAMTMNGDKARFGSVFILAMIPPGAHEVPPIGFNQGDYLPYLH